MPNTRKILIVDDDPEMRDALTEQLSLHEGDRRGDRVCVRRVLALFSDKTVQNG
jgi:CheY-like chemotaxis protein